MYAQHIVIIVLLATLLAFIVSIVRTPEYETRARILIIQRQITPDAFAASQSADYVANLLHEGVVSDSFYEHVAQKNPSLFSGMSSDVTERRKEWTRMVATSVVSGKGVLNVSTYHQNRDTAQQLGTLVIQTLLENGKDYHGAGDSVTLRVLDEPVTSSHPTRPNILLNALAGLVVGFGISFAFVILAPSRRRAFEESEYVEPRVFEPAPSFTVGRVVPNTVPNVQSLEPLPEVLSEAPQEIPFVAEPGIAISTELPKITEPNVERDAAVNIQSWMKRRPT